MDPSSTEFTIIHVLPDPDPLPAFQAAFQARPEVWYEKFVPVRFVHGVLFAVYYFMAILLGIKCMVVVPFDIMKEGTRALCPLSAAGDGAAV